MKNNDDVVFKSKVSRWIAGLYWAILIFLAIMFIGIPLLAPMTFFDKIIFVIAFFIVFLIIVFTLFRAYRLSFVISKDRLLIGGLLKKHEIMFSDINKLNIFPVTKKIVMIINIIACNLFTPSSVHLFILWR